MAEDRGYDVTTLDDSTDDEFRFQRFKGVEGLRQRVGFLADDAGKVAMGKAVSHYIEGLGYVKCNRGVCCELAAEPRTRYAFNVIVYSTDDKGRGIVPLNGVVKTWWVNEGQCDELKGFHEEFGLLEHDVSVLCEDTDFQRLKLSVTKEALLTSEHGTEVFTEDITGKFTMYNRMHPPGKNMTKVVSDAEIKANYGMTESGTGEEDEIITEEVVRNLGAI